MFFELTFIKISTVAMGNFVEVKHCHWEKILPKLFTFMLISPQVCYRLMRSQIALLGLCRRTDGHGNQRDM